MKWAIFWLATFVINAAATAIDVGHEHWGPATLTAFGALFCLAAFTIEVLEGGTRA